MNNKQADAGRETNLSGANGDREVIIFRVQLTMSRIDNLTWLIHITLLYVMTTHTDVLHEYVIGSKNVSVSRRSEVERCLCRRGISPPSLKAFNRSPCVAM